MTGTKNRQKSILMICCLLAVSMLAGCGAKPTDESSNALTESNATISASELVVAGNEIAIGVDELPDRCSGHDSAERRAGGSGQG